MTTDPPPSCETCPHRIVNPNDDYYCEVIGDFIAGEIEMETTKKVGCLFHPLSRAWLNRDVIRELERLKDDNLVKAKEALPHSVSASNCYATSVVAYEKAISLLKGCDGK